MGIETNAEKKENLNKFLSIIDKTFILDSKFKHTFKATLGEMINTLRPAVLGTAPEKDVLLIVRYLFICTNPCLEFNSSSFDFNKFYEESEHAAEEDIQKSLLDKLNNTNL